jgi:hypothetical protein
VTLASQCPFCGQVFDLTVDTSVPSQRFVTDCEGCCRPFEVQAECEPGEILSLEVAANRPTLPPRMTVRFNISTTSCA